MSLIMFGIDTPKAKDNEVWIITSLDWEPYSGAKMFNQGNSIQRLKRILSEQGITLEVEFYPWARAQTVAKNKNYLGYYPAWPEEVKEGFVASSKVDTSNVSIMKRKSIKHKYSGLADICKNYKIGYIQTYVYPDSIDKLIKSTPDCFVRAPFETSLVNMLSTGRFDFALTDSTVMSYLASQKGLSNVVIHQKIMEKGLVVALRDAPDNQKRIRRLEEILTQINLKN